jgi:hypothetical protein
MTTHGLFTGTLTEAYSGNATSIVDAASGQELARVALASAADVDRAVTGRPSPVWRWRLAEGSGARATRRPPPNRRSRLTGLRTAGRARVQCQARAN